MVRAAAPRTRSKTSARTDDLERMFAALRCKLARHTRALAVLTDRPGRYEVTGERPFTVTSLRSCGP